MAASGPVCPTSRPWQAAQACPGGVDRFVSNNSFLPSFSFRDKVPCVDAPVTTNSKSAAAASASAKMVLLRIQIPPWSKQTLRCSPNCYRATLCGLFGALSVILSADVRRFLRVGVKVTLAMQLAFTERPAPPIGQLWVCAKFAVFPLAMVMPEMIRFDPLYLKRPLLYVMLVTVGSNPESPFWGKPNSFVTRCHLESNCLNYQDKYQKIRAIAIIPQNGTRRSAIEGDELRALRAWLRL